MVNSKKKRFTLFTLSADEGSITKGFTLIELLVIIGIIAITTSAGLFSYNTLSKEQTLSSTSKKMIDVLNLTRKRAIAGDTSRGCTGSLQYYKFSKTSASQYDVKVKCTGSSETTLQSYSMASNNLVQMNSMTIMPANTTITGINFSGFNGEISGDATLGTVIVTGTDYVDLTIRVPSLGKCISITINSLGVVTEGEKVSC